MKANEKGKIKIKKVEDYTAAEAEVVVYLPSGISPDQTIDALYAFTSCQVAFSPQTCVIIDNKPVFTTVSEILRHSTFRTRELLRQELEIELGELHDRWYWVSLEKIFFEKGIYKKMEKRDSADWDEQVDDMLKAFGPYKKKLHREVTREDVLKLTEKPVSRISKFNIKKAEDDIKAIEVNIDETENHLAHLTEYAISYFRHILEKYGKNRERRTEIRNFEDIQAYTVAVANEKLYVNRSTGFAGYALKREEGVEVACECSKMDDIIVFRRDGTMMVTRVQEKCFVGTKDCTEIIYISVFHKRDERTVYNIAYRDGNAGYTFVKRFSVTGITRDRDYTLTKGTKGSKILYFSANANGEAEMVTVHHVSKPKIRKTSFDFDFASIAIKGRGAIGNILTRYAVRLINKAGEGISTLGARKIWFDDSVKRLNINDAGRLLGEFKGADRILTIMQSGSFRTTNFDLANHFEDDLLEIRKYNRHNIVTIIYREGESGLYYIKRFSAEEASDKKQFFLADDGSDSLVTYSLDTFPRLELDYGEQSGKKITAETVEVSDFIAVKGFKAKGKRLSTFDIKEFRWLEPLPEPEYEPDDEPAESDDEPNDRLGYAEGTQVELFPDE